MSKGGREESERDLKCFTDLFQAACGRGRSLITRTLLALVRLHWNEVGTDIARLLAARPRPGKQVQRKQNRRPSWERRRGGGVF